MVVGLHERRINEIAQRDAIARLQTAGIFAADARDGGRDFDFRRQGRIGRGGPVKRDHGSGDFGQAGDLSFFAGVGSVENVSRLIIDDDVTLGRAGDREQEKSGQKGEQSGNSHGFQKGEPIARSRGFQALAEGDCRSGAALLN